jgi:hypothetical protein
MFSVLFLVFSITETGFLAPGKKKFAQNQQKPIQTRIIAISLQPISFSELRSINNLIKKFPNAQTFLTD